MKHHQSSKLPVHIVEQHNDVVPFIHRTIASKQLPFSEIPIIHLDSHPDLLIPIHLDADTVFKPQELYESLSIENWLLPLTYAKHVDHVIWVKPPWANQIRSSEQSFSIGKCCHTGKLRLSSKENYFLTDALFCSPSDLRNTAQCKLTVVELRPHNWKDLESGSALSELSSEGNATSEFSQGNETDADVLHKADEETNETSSPCDNTFNSYEKWTIYLQDMTTKPYILDVDLDFFSTKNPFTEIFKAEEEEVLRRIFKCPHLIGLSDEDVETFTVLREKQLQQLEILFTCLDEKWLSEEADAVSMEILSDMSLSDLSGIDADDLDYLSLDVQKDLHSLCQHILPVTEKREITFSQLFDFGCTLDDTDLPHHVSTDDQIQALGSSFRSVLSKLPKPTIVTISRSSHDEYCPKDQVDMIELMVLKILTDTFGNLDVTKNFDE